MNGDGVSIGIGHERCRSGTIDAFKRDGPAVWSSAMYAVGRLGSWHMMMAADGHCRLFSPELASALAAAEAQARGAALRSQHSDTEYEKPR